MSLSLFLAKKLSFGVCAPAPAHPQPIKVNIPKKRIARKLDYLPRQKKKYFFQFENWRFFHLHFPLIKKITLGVFFSIRVRFDRLFAWPAGTGSNSLWEISEGEARMILFFYCFGVSSGLFYIKFFLESKKRLQNFVDSGFRSWIKEKLGNAKWRLWHSYGKYFRMQQRFRVSDSGYKLNSSSERCVVFNETVCWC